MLGFVTIILYLHLGVLCMVSGIPRDGWPDYQYYSEIQGWLKLHQEPVDFRTARTNCHNEGALLASPWLPNFATVINKLQSTNPSLAAMYSGAGLRTGSPGLKMEPCDNKRCSVFLPNGVMDKVNCQKLLPYACYAPAPATSSCGDGYVLAETLGECYKYHPEGATEPSARAICNSEGGYLAVISIEAEKQYLMTLSGFAFIDNGGGGNAYRHLFSTSYSDYYCTAEHPFICEKSPSMVPGIGTDFRD